MCSPEYTRAAIQNSPDNLSSHIFCFILIVTVHALTHIESSLHSHGLVMWVLLAIAFCSLSSEFP